MIILLCYYGIRFKTLEDFSRKSVRRITSVIFGVCPGQRVNVFTDFVLWKGRIYLICKHFKVYSIEIAHASYGKNITIAPTRTTDRVNSINYVIRIVIDKLKIVIIKITSVFAVCSPHVL